MISGLGVQCYFEYEKAHRGDPGNEAADDLAEEALQLCPKRNTWNFLIEPEGNRMVQWLWWTFREDFWRHQEDGRLNFPKPWATADPHVVELMQRHKHHEEDNQTHPFEIRMVSYNVQTVNSKKDKQKSEHVGSPAKITILLDWMKKNRVNIFGLQETRLKRNLPKNKDFHIYQTLATTKGQGGIMIGIALGKDGVIEDEEVKICHGDPELLVLRIQSSNLQALLVCGHAPHTGYPETVVRQWWRGVTEIVEKNGNGAEKILLLDANSRVGSICSQHVGSHQAEGETIGGHELHELAKTTSTWLPATFDTCQWGPGFTWRHPTGKDGRIDFIAIPESWKGLQVSTNVVHGFSLSASEFDHLPILAEVHGHLKCWEKKKTVTFGHRLGKVDCSNQEVREHFKKALKQTPQLSWNLDVHTHVDNFTDYVFRAVRAIPKVHAEDRRRKNHLSEETWQWIETKKRSRKEFFGYREMLRILTLRGCWEIWCDGCQSQDTIQEAKEVDYQIARSEDCMKEANAQVKRRVREEDEKFFEGFGEMMAAADKGRKQRELWREVKRYMPKAKAKKRAQDPKKISQLEGRWAPHICQTEAGKEIELQKIFQRCVNRQNQSRGNVCGLEELPTLLETEVALRRAKTNKASGPDGVSADWLHHFADDLTPTAWQLLFKTHLWNTEPFQHKGGSLCMLYKKGQIYEPSSYRAIMLMSTLGKQLHSTTRPRVMETLEKVKRPGQIGGFKKMEPGFGGLYMKTLQRVAFARQKNCALIFFDLKMAFHGLVREGIYGKDGTEEEEMAILHDHLEEAGLPVDQIMGDNMCGGYLRKIQAPETLVKLLQEYGSNNWTEIQGHTIQTNKGSRPGSPLADCLFHIQMCEMSHHIDRALKEEEASRKICQDIGIDNEAIYWADDLCVGVLADECEELDKAVERITQKVQQIFSQRGFEVNFGKNKSEVLLTYKGKEAPNFRRKLLTGERAFFEIDKGNKEMERLRVGAAYKHLGAMQECGGAMNMELQHRCAQTWDAWRVLRKNVLCSRKLSLKTRIRLAESLLFSKLFHAAGTWPVLTPAQIRKIDRVYTYILRSITREHFKKDQNRTFKKDERFFAHYQLPRVERLLFAKRLTRNAERLLGALLEAEDDIRSDSWKKALKTDIAWLVEAQGESWGKDLSTMQASWKNRHGWAGFVKKGVQRHVLQTAIACKIADGNAIMEEHQETEAIDDTFTCECGEGFKSAKGLAVHKYKKHGQHTKEYWLQEGTRCECCLMEMWTQQRLQTHLKYQRGAGRSNQCAAFLLARSHEIDLTVDAKTQNELLLKGLRRREAIQTCGPLPFGARADHENWTTGCIQEIENGIATRYGFCGLEEARDKRKEQELENLLKVNKEGIGGLLEELAKQNLSNLEVAVTMFFWGREHDWESTEGKEEWLATMEDIIEGPTVLEWNDLDQKRVFCERIRRNVNQNSNHGAPVLREKRIAGEINIQHPLKALLETAIFPLRLGVSFCTQKSFWDLCKPDTRLSTLRAWL